MRPSCALTLAEFLSSWRHLHLSGCSSPLISVVNIKHNLQKLVVSLLLLVVVVLLSVAVGVGAVASCVCTTASGG